MMPNVTSQMLSLSVSGKHCWATLWTITRKDGVVFRFTDHDQELSFLEETYLPGASSLSASARQKLEGTDAQNLDVKGAITSDSITEADLRAGKYREAVVQEFVVDWRFPWAGKFITCSYRIEETQRTGDAWTAKLAGFKIYLQQTVGDTYSKECRWKEFGGPFCGLDLAPLTQSSKTVSAVVKSRKIFNTDLIGEDGLFDDGKITWTSGSNAGLVSEIKSFESVSGRVELQLPTPGDIEDSDEFTAVPGCDRLEDTCRAYGNFNRFGGFVFIPGNDALYSTPSSQ